MFTKSKGTDTGSDKKQTPMPTPAQTAIRPAAAKPTARSGPSIISADMTIIGSVTSDGEMQIDGKIEGDIGAISLTIGQTGSVRGEVRAQTVVVRGRIIGSIRARKVELESGAHVEGDIVHASLAIQSNAVFEGQVKHTADPLKQVQTELPAPKPAIATPNTEEATAAKPATSTPTTGFGIPN